MNKSGIKKKVLIAAVIIVVLASCLLLSWQIKTVEIIGNHQYTKEGMIQMIFPAAIDHHTVYAYIREHTKEHENIPFVESYKVIFRSLNKVEIIVYEKSVVGYVSYMGNYLYFDKDGIVVESSQTELEGIPQISGLKFGHVILHRKLPVKDDTVFNEILNLTQILSDYDFEVDRIHYDSYKNAELFIDDIQVILGSSQWINGKIALLDDMLPELQGLSGTLSMDNYDESNSSPTVTFKRK